MPNGTDDPKDTTGETTNRKRSSSLLSEEELENLLSDLNAGSLDEISPSELDRHIEDTSVTLVEQERDRLLSEMVDRIEEEAYLKALAKKWEETGLSSEKLEELGGLESEKTRKFLEDLETFGLEEPPPEENKVTTPIFYEFTLDEIDEIVREVENDYDHATKYAIKNLELNRELLEKKRDYYENNASWKDRIKAFFKHGAKGIHGEIAKIDRRMEEVDRAIEDLKQGITPEQRREQVEFLKAALAENRLQLEKRAQQSLPLRLNKTGLAGTGLTPESRELAENAMEEAGVLESVRKQLKTQLKESEKALHASEKAESVRESVGGGPRKIPQPGTEDGSRGAKI